jgi:hypothetical protein
VKTERRRHDKIVEWGRRYLLLEIAGWVGELGGAALGYLWTGSLAAAALVATSGGLVAYYFPAYVMAVRWSIPKTRHRPWAARQGWAHLLAVRSLAIEFGPAEAIDTLLLRPGLIYATPVLLGDVVWGWVIGGFLADVAFYVFTIISYERFKGLLAQRHPPSVQEYDHEPTTSTATA